MSSKNEYLEQLVHEFRDVFRRTRREINELLGDEVSSNEFFILVSLDMKSNQRISDFAHALKVSTSHVTVITDQLVKKGYITRMKSKSDRRVVELALTDEGRQLVQSLIKKRTEYLKQKFEKLSLDEVKTCIAIFQKIR